MSTIIKVENISKQYRLGEVGTGAIKDDIKRWRYRMMGKEDPFLMVGAENDRTKTGKDDYVWALKDINFEVKQGEVLGIIGRNGAGKSTLLKILSRTTTPTTGSIKIKGRIASLLEVGTGFHPELSGRDNIFLNGAILGMTKTEIRSKFDEIVDFAGVEKYIDTPVKRYSSGMYVRLAFGVAAHLEPEILIVDEVLAVGDAEFQKKALGKMKDVSVNDGRTVLFVSHNMGAIKALCTKTVLLNNGQVYFEGTSQEGIDKYLGGTNSEMSSQYINENPSSSSDILEIKVLNPEGKLTSRFGFDQPITVSFEVKVAHLHLDAYFGMKVRDQMERIVFTTEIPIRNFVTQHDIAKLSVEIPAKLLVPNNYHLIIGFHLVNVEILRLLEAPVQFVIEETGTNFYKYPGVDYGCVFVDCKWSALNL